MLATGAAIRQHVPAVGWPAANRLRNTTMCHTLMAWLSIG